MCYGRIELDDMLARRRCFLKANSGADCITNEQKKIGEVGKKEA